MSSLNFLALVQRVYRESGLAGAGPTTVAAQTGRYGDVVHWVLDAYEEIQGMRTDWNWDWAQGTFTLVANTDTYDPIVDFLVAAGIRDFSRALTASYCYPTSVGVNSRLFMRFLEWEQFRGLVVPVAPGTQPTSFTLRPDGDVQYYPVPSVAVTVVHEYWRNPQTLAADEDVLRIPAKFHMAVVWAAVMKGCGKTQNFARWDTAEEEFNKLLRAMERECLPRMMLGAPLA